MGDLIQREHPKIRVEYGWGQEHIKAAKSPKRCKTGPRLVLRTNRKSHTCTRFRLVPKSMTLDIMRMMDACSLRIGRRRQNGPWRHHFSHFLAYLPITSLSQRHQRALPAEWRATAKETVCGCVPAQPSRLLLWNKPKKSFILLPRTLKCQIFNSNLTNTVQWNWSLFYHVNHMNLQIAYADNVTQIDNLTPINRHI